jgi:hypothetical protein
LVFVEEGEDETNKGIAPWQGARHRSAYPVAFNVYVRLAKTRVSAIKAKRQGTSQSKQYEVGD